MACYVPFCESAIPYKKGAKRDPSISFHQFPSDAELRKKWIVAIGRKDPNTGAYWDPFGSALVCSLHFSPKQFKGSTKKRILENGSIPFIFPDYHLPQRGALIDLSSIEIIPFPGNADLEGNGASSQSSNNNRNNKTKRTFSQMNSQSDNAEIIQSSSSTSKSQSKIQKLVVDQPVSDNLPLEVTSNADFTAESSSVTDISSDSSLTQSPIHNTMENITKTDKFLLTKLNSEISKNHRLESEILKLQEENETLNLKNKIMEEKLELFNIEELKKGISSSNAKALFLFDQLYNLTKGRSTWSESTVEFAKNLEEKLPACYNFLRQADIITLPPPKNVSCSDHDVCVE